MLEPVTVSLITERRVSAPAGRQGGGPGAVGKNWLLPGGDESKAESLWTNARYDCRRATSSASSSLAAADGAGLASPQSYPASTAPCIVRVAWNIG